MALTIAVIDGMGGGIGAQLVERLKKAFGEEVLVCCLGTNASATERMLKAGADRGATGENAIRVNLRGAGIVMGPIGIIVPNGLMGEISPATAQAVSESGARIILIPVQQPHFSLTGLEARPMAQLIAEAVEMVRAGIQGSSSTG